MTGPPSALPLAHYRADAAGALLTVEGLDRLADDAGPVPSLASRPWSWETLVLACDRERVAAARATPLAEGERWSGEYRLALGRRVLWVSDHALGVPGDAAGARQGVLLDRSAQRQDDARAERRRRCAALSGLAGGLAHEVNNPLSGVLNYLQLAERLAPSGEPRLAEALGGAIAEGRRVLGVTRALAQVASRSEGAAPHSLPVHDLARACLSFLRRELREAFVRVDVDVPEALPPVRGLGTALPLALLAGLENALDALRGRFAGPAPSNRLTLRAAAGPDDVTLTVEDGGGGLAAEAEARAFEPFFGTRPDRLGLGLTLAREAVREVGGEVSLRSTAGGAALSLRLSVG